MTSLTARLTARPRRTLLAVLLFTLIAGALGGPVAGSLKDSGGFATTDSGSARAVERIQAATGRDAEPAILLLVETPGGLASAPARARLSAIRAVVARQPGVAAVAGARDAADPTLVARDGRSTVLAATLTSSADEDAVAGALLERFATADDVIVGGPAVGNMQVGDRVGTDLGRAEMLAFPLLLVLSLLFFRGRATVLPLVVGVITILGAFLVLRAINEAYGLSIFALNLVIGLGLGLAIDYTLFLVTRYREELERHGPGPAAIHATVASAGRTVAFSAVTVAIALAALTLFPLGFARSMGIAGATVALVAGVASLVVTPTLFALWGAKLAVHRRRPARAPEAGGWYRLAHGVMRRPVAVAVATTVVMLTLALPALRAQFTPIDATAIPRGETSRTVADRLERDFPRVETSPVTLAIDAPRGDAAAVGAYAAGLRRLPGVVAVSPATRLDEATWQVGLAVRGAPEGPAARAVVERLRSAGAPFGLLVGGAAAKFVDQQAAISSRLPLAIGVLVALTFTVLWLMTGSVVLPLKALVMNALTVASALGALTLVYQAGRFEGLLRYTGNGGVEPTDFLVTAAIVFALSTDYGVFLLGRIKEERDAGRGEREAVAVGVERTGAVVTAAAILLAVAIGAFATSSISFIQQIGVATATGVLLDAFVVRALLVPSLMALLGRWNWWSPPWLRRAHDRFGPREEPRAAVAALST